MTILSQKRYEKYVADFLVDKLNTIENRNVVFLRFGVEGKETDLVYIDDDQEIGIEITDNRLRTKNKIKTKKYRQLKEGEYIKDTEVRQSLGDLVTEKNKKYINRVKWLLIANRFSALAPSEFQTIFLDGYKTGWNQFARAFVIFEEIQSVNINPSRLLPFEINLTNNRLIEL